MIPVNFEPAVEQTVTFAYPIWTVLGLVFVVAVIAGLVLWYKTRESPNKEPERICELNAKIEYRDSNGNKV